MDTAVLPIEYVLGRKDTTELPVPVCSQVVGFWTALYGPVWVTVLADGPTTVKVAINDADETTKVANIEGGQTTHIFEFPGLDPLTVHRVVITASDSVRQVGGSCVATGSPTS